MNTTDTLVGLSLGELEALADGCLAPSTQARLEELQSKNRSSTDDEELDRLLERIDQLNLLKARARLTLAHPTATSA